MSATQSLLRWWEALREPSRAEAIWLFTLHATVALLITAEWSGLRLEAWHWPEYILNTLLPLTAAWLITQARAGQASAGAATRRTAARCGIWLAASLAATLAGWRLARFDMEGALAAGLGLGFVALAPRLLHWLPARLAVAAIALATPPAWYYYHRTSNAYSWVAFVPLAAALAAWRPGWLRAGVWAYIGLNTALLVGLQVWVRPTQARDFFTVQPGYTEALHWLESNTPPDSVVVTNSWMSDHLIRSYSHNLTEAGISWWSGARISENIERIAIRSAIYRVPPATVERKLDNWPEAVAEFKANVNQHWIGGPEMDGLFEQQSRRLIDPAEYYDYYAQPLDDLLGRYRVDYIWVGPWERQVGEFDFGSEPRTRLVFENGFIQIYQVVDAP